MGVYLIQDGVFKYVNPKFAELKADEDLRDEIIEQVNKIDRLIEKLDKGWIESEKVREFLRSSK